MPDWRDEEEEDFVEPEYPIAPPVAPPPVATPTDTQRAAFEAEQRRYAEEGPDVAPPVAPSEVAAPSMADRQREMAAREQEAALATVGEFDPADLSGELPDTVSGYVPPPRPLEDWRDIEDEEGAESDAAYQRTIDPLQERIDLRLADAGYREQQELKLPEDLGPGVTPVGEPAPIDWRDLEDPEYDPFGGQTAQEEQAAREAAAVQAAYEAKYAKDARTQASTTVPGEVTTTATGQFTPAAPGTYEMPAGWFGGPAATAPGGPLPSPFAGGLDPRTVDVSGQMAFVDESADSSKIDAARAKMLKRMNAPRKDESYVPADSKTPTKTWGTEPVKDPYPPLKPPKTETKAEGGIIEEEFMDEVPGTSILDEADMEEAPGTSIDEIPNEILNVITEAIQRILDPNIPTTPEDQQAVLSFREVVKDEPGIFEEVMRRAQSGIEVEAPREMQVGGLIPGNGAGMADDIITTADAGTPEAQQVALSSGEYVVPADVLSGLGDGNTDAGVKVMEQLQTDVRMAKTGFPEQPPPIDLSDVLPVTYGERYA